MHDPMTVAFELKYPWRKYGRRDRRGDFFRKHRETWLTVWHVDPEVGGSDDSCGWSYVRVSKADREWAAKEAEREWSFWFAPDYGSINVRGAGPIEIVHHAYATVRRRVQGTPQWIALSARDLDYVLRLVSNPHDNIRSTAHRASLSTEGLADLLFCLLRIYRTLNRRWWQHPRWHVWHWRIKVEPLLDLKRWLFSRCAGCAGRFTWGYAPVTHQWGGEGPGWFRGEPGVFHERCSRLAAKAGD